MGTWDVGPFDNDTAADLGGDLDEVAAGEREGIVRSALTRVIDTAAYLEAPESEVAVAVAAGALVAAQCPGGEPADPIYWTEEFLPNLTGLRDPSSHPSQAGTSPAAPPPPLPQPGCAASAWM
ncbi:DUF4259 domain-containing protein [Streptomyces sp. NPDC005303]|uniref:DUF4259 domain-containing protein n=1 Tax=Streptomyces sp. NPDC005303 TaxID=3155713 RepID=UPI0033A94073